MPIKESTMSDIDDAALARQRKLTKICVLGGLVAILLIVLFIQFVTAPEPPPEGARRVMVCPNCRHAEQQKVKEIGETYCPKCGTMMGYGWKCKECDFEYSVVLMPIKGEVKGEYLEASQKGQTRCPNCGSDRTRAMRLKDLEK